MNAADGCTRILVGRGGDGAGVQDDDFRLDGRGGALQSAGEQLALDSGAIGLGRAASEVLDMIGRHQAIILGVLCGWRRVRGGGNRRGRRMVEAVSQYRGAYRSTPEIKNVYENCAVPEGTC